MKLWKKGLFIISVTIFSVSLSGIPIWGQPISMGRVELKGNARIEAGNGLVFQAPRDLEAPLMPGAKVSTGKKGEALFDWSGKGSMVLDENSEADVGKGGVELFKGKLTLRMNPGQELRVKALDNYYLVKAPPNKVGIATIEIENNKVKIAGLIFLEGGGGTVAGASMLGPALFAGGAIAGVIAVAASNNGGGGGGGHVSPSSP